MYQISQNHETRNLNFHYLYIVIAVWVCFHNSLWGEFVFDDIPAIVNNKDLRRETPLTNLFKHDYWGNSIKSESSHKSFRPLTTITFRWNYIRGLNPLSYHITNLLLHSLVSCLFYKFCDKLISHSSGPLYATKQLGSFKIALLFAVHPIHTEVVSNIVGRSELLSAIFFLLSALFYMSSIEDPKETRWSLYYLSIILPASAMLCKENGVTVIALCAIYDILLLNKYSLKNLYLSRTDRKGPSCFTNKEYNIEFWKHVSHLSTRLLGLLSSLITCLLIRYSLMGGQIPHFTSYDNPASHAPSPIRQLTYSYLGAFNFWKIINPSTLSCDWSMNSIPLIKSFYDIRFFVTISVGVLILVCISQTLRTYLNSHFIQKTLKAEIIALEGWAILILPFIPASNMFYPVGFVLAERVLYISSMGFCLLFYVGHEKIKLVLQNRKIFMDYCYLLIVLMFALKTFMRNNDWGSEKSIMKAGIKAVPSNAKLWNNVGLCLEEDNELELALRHFEIASHKQFDDVGAYINIGRVHQKLKQFKLAESAFAQAVSLLNNNHIQTLINPENNQKLSRVHGEVKEFQTPINIFANSKATQNIYHIPIDWLNAYIMMGDLIALNKSRIKEADYYYLAVLRLKSNHIPARAKLLQRGSKFN